MSFLTTRVTKINVGDWKNLRIFISYLNQTVDNVRVIGGYNLTDLFAWVYVSCDVHPNMRTQTRVLMSMGYGVLNFHPVSKI